MCPTRELAMQVADEVHKLSAHKRGIHAVPIYGGASYERQFHELKKGVQIVIGTPGRIMDHMQRGTLRLDAVKMVVLDEADRMLDMGFLPQVDWVLSRAPEGRAKWLLSATLPRQVEDLVHKKLSKPEKISVGTRNAAAAHLAHRRMLVDEELKTPALLSLLAQEDLRRGIVVYCASRRRTGWVAGALRKHEISAAVVHGDRSQLQREKALESFAHGRCRVLVATDVAARGLHVPGIKLVINYDVPVSPEEWIHRVGRAGHGGGEGASVTFVSPDERVRWESVVQLAQPEWDSMLVPEDVASFMRDRDKARHERAQAEQAEVLKALELKEKAEKEKAKRLKDAARKRKMKSQRYDTKQFRGTKSNTPVEKGTKRGTGVKKLG